MKLPRMRISTLVFLVAIAAMATIIVVMAGIIVAMANTVSAERIHSASLQAEVDAALMRERSATSNEAGAK